MEGFQSENRPILQSTNSGVTPLYEDKKIPRFIKTLALGQKCEIWNLKMDRSSQNIIKKITIENQFGPLGLKDHKCNTCGKPFTQARDSIF